MTCLDVLLNYIISTKNITLRNHGTFLLKKMFSLKPAKPF